MPAISIIMPVYNGGKYLIEAVDSILNQTFSDFELIIIEDASSDLSYSILKKYKDSRIILIRNNENLGITKSLNRGLNKAKGKYIARMDADDVSLPNRLKRQFEVLEENPNIGVVGTFAKSIDENGIELNLMNLPKDDIDIKSCLFWGNQIIHPSVMIRKEVLISNNIKYDETFNSSQDYKLWIDLMDKTSFHNLPEMHLKYRILESGITKQTNKNVLHKTNTLKKIYNTIFVNNGIVLNEDELELYTRSVLKFEETDIYSANILSIFKKILNELPQKYNKKKLYFWYSSIWVLHDKLKTWNTNTILYNLCGIGYYVKTIYTYFSNIGVRRTIEKVKSQL